MNRFFVVLSLLLCSAAARAEWRVAPVSSLVKLTATAPGKLEAFRSQPALLRAARGETESFQVVISAGDKPLRVSLSVTHMVSPLGETIDSRNIQIFHQRFVYVEKPSSNRQLKKLWWPDALVPLSETGTVEIEANASATFWVCVKVPRDAAPQAHFGSLDIVTNDGNKDMFMGVEVQRATLGAPTMRATAALYYDVLRDWYTKNIGPQSDASWSQTKRAYYDFLLEFGINAYDLPVEVGDEFSKYARDPRVHSIRTPPPTSPEFAPFVAALKKAGALSKAFSYRHDEPAPDKYAAIRADAALLHAAGVKHLVTTVPNAKLENAVDIWCPNIGDGLGIGHFNLAALQRERAKGKETWWYTMAVPRAPYPTWLLDDDSSSVRVYGWQMARWGISGFVYSMVHGWGPKPLENLQSFAGTNGDGTLVYPGELVGERGPIPSIRLMLLRDAMEDYELLRALPEKARVAITSHAVDDFAPRGDEETAWQSGSYRQKLFAALEGKAVAPRVRKAPPIPTLTLRRITAEAQLGALPPLPTEFARWKNDAPFAGITALRAAIVKNDLVVSLKAENQDRVHWAAVEIAPANARERWRFVVPTSGKNAVERHTPEGRFAVDGAQWEGTAERSFSTVLYKWRIPLELLDENISTFRFNVVRRVYDSETAERFSVRAFPDNADATQMPLVKMTK
ncbi:MAG TPA: DUF4091 domain-containing protein [Abditibacteriaceae bacterium]|jgi:hypothetical protein